MAGFPTLLQPQQEVALQQQKNAAQNQYGSGLAQLNYQQGNAAADYGTNMADLTRQLKKMRESINPAYNQRGLLRSGLFRGALQENAQDAASRLAALNSAYQRQVGGFGINQQQLAGDLSANLAGIDQNRLAQLAQLALGVNYG